MVKEKWKGKEWYEVVAPKIFNNIFIGETPAADAALIKGRIIEASLSNLVKDPNKYYIKFYFKISDLDGSKANTIFAGHDCTRDFVARIVQIRTSRIDTNGVFELKDNKIRVKTIAVTNRSVKVSVKSAIRKTINEKLKEILSEKDTDSFITDMISGKIQQTIKKELSKIYPVRFFEFRKTEVI